MSVTSVFWLACLCLGEDVATDVPPVVAVVGNDWITHEQLEKRLSTEIYRSGQQWPPSRVEQERPKLERQVLQKMVEDLLVLQEARRQLGEDGGIAEVQVDARIEDRVKDMREISSPEGYYRAMNQLFGLSRKEVRRELREDMIIVKFLWENVYRDVDRFVAPEEARYYYRTHRETFTEPVKISFRHIYLRDTRTALMVMQKIDEGLKQGVKFEELARLYSEDTDDEEQRGRLLVRDFKDLAQYWQACSDVLRTLKKGAVSRPVRSDRAIHFLKLEDREEGEPKPFADALPEIQERIRSTRRNLAYRRFLERVRKRTRVENFLPALPGQRAEKES